MALLDIFWGIQLKSQFKLCAYQYSDQSNGNGYVYALPENSPFPEPSRKGGHPATPDDALEDVMAAVDGDDSPWSYVSASIFAREIAEWGASWHGCSWSTHEFIGRDPFATAEDGHFNLPVHSSASDWKWKSPKPDDWRPKVFMDESSRTVVFYTYSGLGLERIFEHTDRFIVGSYRFARSSETLAEGIGGYIF